MFIDILNIQEDGADRRLKRTASILVFSTMVHSMKAQDTCRCVQSKVVLQTTFSWDGSVYQSYPHDAPQLTVVRISIPPRTTLNWHQHPSPNAAYVLSGELTLEKKDGTSRHFKAGDAIAETVDVVHRGISGGEQTVLIVFYAGAPSLPLTEPITVS
jgi:quercetin dioxygenase-like cupin family protein